jgi:outer membrane murein-binding lipoprotein Lpp
VEINDAAGYQEQRIALAADQVARMEGKVAKTEEQLDAAREALEAAKAELDQVRHEDVEFVEPTEHASVQAQ